MKFSRWIILSGTIVLAVLMVLVTVTGLSKAQEPQPDRNNDAALSPDVSVYNVIPIQGRLTDDSGNPIDGTRVITFSLYATTYATTPLCQDDDSVAIDNGLFNAEMDWCTSEDIDGRRLYLGIEVEGDAEMTPRERIYPVPYAFSLRPGAIISGSTSSAIVHVENWHSSGRGLRVYAMSETGTNYGIVGASRSPDGYGGYFYNNGGGTALFAKAITASGHVYGIHGESEANLGRGVYGEASNASGGIGVEGSSIVGSGVYGYSSEGIGVYAETGNASGNYGLYTPNNIFSLNYHSMGATMQVVQNAGKEALELGDVVAFSGIRAPLESSGPPVIQVVGTADANNTAVAGVVFSRFNIEAVTSNIDPANPFSGEGITSDGPVASGEYMLVVVRGPAQVKASALESDIQPGDLLSSASQIGYAGKATEITIDGNNTPIPGSILGKALEPLEAGQKLVYIFVTLQ